MTTLGEFLRKWWLPAALILLATTPPGIVLFLQDSLAPPLASLAAQQPTTVIKLLALLLWLCLVLFAFLFLQRPWLRWDEPTGTWVSRFTALRYCAKCRATKIVTPLKNEVTGWQCMHCQHFFHDPARAHIESPKKKAAKSERI